MTSSTPLQQWRTWAQFVFLGGGPVCNTDDQLRAKICALFDEMKLTLGDNAGATKEASEREHP